MSFDKLKVQELRDAAEAFGVEVSPGAPKAAVLKALQEEGVSFAMYDAIVNAEKVDVEDALDVFVPRAPEPAPLEDSVLVKMERANGYFQINGHVFTSEHPFVTMSEDDAQEIFDSETGFRLATPSEVRSYYS